MVEEIFLDEEDELALDAVWERIEKDGWGKEYQRSKKSPDTNAMFAFDIHNRKAQGILNSTLKAAKKISAAAKRDLSAALEEGGSGEAILNFINKYRIQLARVLTQAQLASLLEGASEVADKVPTLATFPGAVPPPPTLEPEEAVELIDRLADMSVEDRAKAIYDLPADQQSYAYQAIAAKDASPPIRPPDFLPTPDESSEDLHFPIIDEAVKHLAEKNVLTRDQYDALNAAARAKAFTVANVAAEETLAKIRDSLAENVREGADYDSWKKKVLEDVESGTFMSDGHQETIFRTNVQTAFSDGQASVLAHPLVRSGFPYSTYDAIHDDRARENHLALERHGIQGTNVYRADDPVFQMFRPPWEWGDRCGWTPLTVRQAAERGISEAKEWLETGVEPEHKAYVSMPPFRPPEGFQRAVAAAPLSIQLSMQPMASFAHNDDSGEVEDIQERAEAIADLFLALYGDGALDMLNEAMSGDGMAFAQWDPAKHPKGKDGRFIKKNSPEAVSLVKESISASLKKDRSPESVGELMDNLNLLTVAQIHDLRKEMGLKASGKNRDELVAKIADRLDRGRREPVADREADDDDRSQNKNKLKKQARDKLAKETENLRGIISGNLPPREKADAIDSAKERIELLRNLVETGKEFDEDILKEAGYDLPNARQAYDLDGDKSPDKINDQPEDELMQKFGLSKPLEQYTEDEFLQELADRLGPNLENIDRGQIPWDLRGYRIGPNGKLQRYVGIKKGKQQWSTLDVVDTTGELGRFLKEAGMPSQNTFFENRPDKPENAGDDSPANFEMTRREFMDELKRSYDMQSDDEIPSSVMEDHKRDVENALRQGMPVPPEVLADYPDLAAKYPQADDTADQETQTINDSVTKAVDTYNAFRSDIGNVSFDQIRATVKDLNDLSKTEVAEVVRQVGFQPGGSKKDMIQVLQNSLEGQKGSKVQTDEIEKMRSETADQGQESPPPKDSEQARQMASEAISKGATTGLHEDVKRELLMGTKYSKDNDMKAAAALEEKIRNRTVPNREQVETSVLTSVSDFTRKNPTHAQTFAEIYDNVKKDHPEITKDQMQSVLMTLGEQDKIHLVAYTGAIYRLEGDNLDMAFPAGKDVRAYARFADDEQEARARKGMK